MIREMLEKVEMMIEEDLKGKCEKYEKVRVLDFVMKGEKSEDVKMISEWIEELRKDVYWGKDYLKFLCGLRKEIEEMVLSYGLGGDIEEKELMEMLK